MFLRNDLDLGRITVVKHKIKLIDYTPFKDHYRYIPPGMYQEVRAHLQDMLDIAPTRPPHRIWTSELVLVRKRDGKLHVCIDLRKLNGRTVKESYRISRIEETLDCLHWAVWFTSLDLMSGYRQKEMEEESKPLTTFTAGPLGSVSVILCYLG